MQNAQCVCVCVPVGRVLVTWRTGVWAPEMWPSLRVVYRMEKARLHLRVRSTASIHSTRLNAATEINFRQLTRACLSCCTP